MKALFDSLIILCVGCNIHLPKDSSITYSLTESKLWSTYPAEKDRKNKHVVLVSGDEEYRSEEVLPEMARILSSYHGYDCTVLYAQDPSKSGIVDPNYSYNIPGLSHLEHADIMVLFTRFRSLPDSQMAYIDNFLKEGNPVVAIRTATHAFNYSDTTHSYAHYGWNYSGKNSTWHKGFGKKVLGETWYTHHGHHKHQSTRGLINDINATHPILYGIDKNEVWGATDVYGIRQPLGNDAVILMHGQSMDRTNPYDANDLTYGMRETDNVLSSTTPITDPEGYNPNETLPPIVRLNTYQLPEGVIGRSLTSTIGSSSDFLNENVRKILINGVYHLTDEPVSLESFVKLSSSYLPSQFAFKSDSYWDSIGIVIENIN